jgi:AraC family transcriptional regulator
VREDTREIYRARILDVLQHISVNLDRELGLDDLARVARFSPFHFHRVFRGVTGESLASLVRRLKLEQAAHRLLTGLEPVMVIALRAGYDSNQTFTRAFSAAFGEPPSVFRRTRAGVPALPAPSGYHYHPDHGVRFFEPVMEGAAGMDGSIIQLERMKVLCVRHIGPYNQVGEAFCRLSDLVSRLGLDVSGSKWLAIYHDDPSAGKPEELRSDACVTIDTAPAVEGIEGVTIQDIVGGMYAMTRHTGSYSHLGRAWGEFCGGWIPAAGYRPRCAPCFEIYVVGHGDGVEESEFVTDIYEPVEPVS